MTVAAVRTRREPRYVGLFPSWEGRRPVGWFFAEQLLEARAESDFPTNSAGDDEDVNVYLMGLLRGWVTDDPRTAIAGGIDPLTDPDRARATTSPAEWWRRQADHRLLALGLFDRGDLVRRRRIGWRFTEEQARARDLTVLQRSYALAAELVAGRPDRRAEQAVWRKLARHAPQYVHVLQTLARRRLGLGARIDDDALARLMATT
jgi:hypothetical protein